MMANQQVRSAEWLKGTFRRRWIVIGAVRAGVYVIHRNAGTPNCFGFNWRGRVGLFQPEQFVGWAHLVAAIDHRLGMAGLERVGLAVDVERAWLTGARTVWVEVQRIAECGLRIAELGMERSTL
jgi:hypothetical protein